MVFIHAPIKKSPFHFQNHSLWYDAEQLKMRLNNITFDSVIVDGPPGVLPYSRYGAIPFIKDHLAPNFSMILDDTNRNVEEEIFEEWAKFFPNCFIQKFNRFSRIYTEENFNPTPLSLKQILYP